MLLTRLKSGIIALKNTETLIYFFIGSTCLFYYPRTNFLVLLLINRLPMLFLLPHFMTFPQVQSWHLCGMNTMWPWYNCKSLFRVNNIYCYKCRVHFPEFFRDTGTFSQLFIKWSILCLQYIIDLVTALIIWINELIANLIYSKLTFLRPLSTDGPGFVSGSYPWVPDGMRELVFSSP